MRPTRHLPSNFHTLLTHLEAAFLVPLPGVEAQALMAPRPPRLWPQGFDQRGVRDAAGLLLLFPVDEQPHLVLTVRAETLRHGGQVSLPGGAVDAGESFEDAARREAREEIGLDERDVRILGALTPIDIHVSGFRLHPIVAATFERPLMTPATGEVARILEIPLNRLARPGSRSELTMVRDDQMVVVPTFLVDGIQIWGATAMVLAEFLALLDWVIE